MSEDLTHTASASKATARDPALVRQALVLIRFLSAAQAQPLSSRLRPWTALRMGQTGRFRPITHKVSTLRAREDGARLRERGGEPCPEEKGIRPVYRVAVTDANRPGRRQGLIIRLYVLVPAGHWPRRLPRRTCSLLAES